MSTGLSLGLGLIIRAVRRVGSVVGTFRSVRGGDLRKTRSNDTRIPR